MVVVCGCLSFDGDVVVNGLVLMCCACVVVAVWLWLCDCAMRCWCCVDRVVV